MINYFYLILGYLIFFFLFIFIYYRLKKVELGKEDYLYLRKIDQKINILKNRIFKLVQISEKELLFLWFSFLEKVLRRIKVEALKIESWAGNKLEKLKKENQ